MTNWFVLPTISDPIEEGEDISPKYIEKLGLEASGFYIDSLDVYVMKVSGDINDIDTLRSNNDVIDIDLRDVRNHITQTNRVSTDDVEKSFKLR